ncbi:MAG: sortase [Candidatus Moranbacteria bacterium]|nr:sortase [Candidatus Moranbacteria bacterium]
MLQISDKTKFELKRAGILISLFLGTFFLGFYIVNLLDLQPTVKTPSKKEAVQDSQIDIDLLKKTSADGINLADFSAWVKANKLAGKDVYNADPDGDGLPNFLEYIHGTDPNNADTDGDKFSDKQEITNGYDPDAPGDAKPLVFVKIEKVGVDAPMVWSQSEDDKKTLKDLENGLSHFPKTAAPGDNGNSIISGHSSNYVWAKGDFNHIFKDLNDLQNGDVIDIKTIQANGKIITYEYKVNDKFVATPEDEKIFANTENPTLTLSTCWPLGTNLKRLIVKAEYLKMMF